MNFQLDDYPSNSSEDKSDEEDTPREEELLVDDPPPAQDPQQPITNSNLGSTSDAPAAANTPALGNPYSTTPQQNAVPPGAHPSIRVPTTVPSPSLQPHWNSMAPPPSLQPHSNSMAPTTTQQPHSNLMTPQTTQQPHSNTAAAGAVGATAPVPNPHSNGVQVNAVPPSANHSIIPHSTMAHAPAPGSHGGVLEGVVLIRFEGVNCTEPEKRICEPMERLLLMDKKEDETACDGETRRWK